MAPSRPPRPPSRIEKDPKEQLKRRGADLIRKISDKDRYAIFLEPVDTEQVRGYKDVINRPMDLSTAQKNLQEGVYRTPMELRADIDLIWSNCCVFNDDTSIYFREAVRLRALAARYYDDFVRVLTRDGVAAELGLTHHRHNGPTRIPNKRPRQLRTNSQLDTSTGKEDSIRRDKFDGTSSMAEGTASASASASALARQNAISDIHLRRAQSAYDAAKNHADDILEEANQAAKAAGIPLSPSAMEKEIFKGPKAPYNPSLLNQVKRDSCAQIPYHWRQLGRWHSHGRIQPKFLTYERARNVHYGRKYDKFIYKSAPVARRLLAILLDPELVQEHDSVQNRINANNHTLERIRTPQFSLGQNCLPKANGISNLSPLQLKGEDRMDVDEIPSDTKTQHERRGTSTTPRKHANSPLPNGTRKVDRTNEDLLKDIIGKAQYEKVSKIRKSSPRNGATGSISKNSIYRLRSLLRAKGVDPSFVTGLMHESENIENRSSKDHLSDLSDYKQMIDENGRPHSQNLSRLLQANHATMMNVLRLRALREQAHFSVHEDLEDREREYMDILSSGMTLAVRNLPPRFVAHPVDIAEAAESFSRTINSPTPRPNKN